MSARHYLTIALWATWAYPGLTRGEAPSAGPLALNDGDVVVFCGDELTETPDPQRGVTFPVLIETFLTVRYPDLRVRYHNAGWAGDSATRVGLRLERDVLTRKPTLVVICLGMNDPQYYPFGEKPGLLETFRKELTGIVKRCRDTGARVWLVSPPSVKEKKGQTARVQRDGKPFFVDLAALSYNKTLAQVTAAIKQIAEDNDAGFVNWFEAMTAARQGIRPDQDDFYARRETRLPQAHGHALAAARLLEAWGAKPIHATIELDWKTGKAKVEVADTEPNPASAAVTITDDGQRILDVKGLPLPWPVPGTRTSGLQPHWEAARLSQIIFKMTDPPKLGIKLAREAADAGTKGNVTITAAQLKSGFNLAAVSPVHSIKEVQDLLKWIRLKNTYQYSIWRRLELAPPQEPELAEPQKQLIGAWASYATGYEKIIARYPKTFDAKLILAEATPDERLPTSQPSKRPKTRTGRRSRRGQPPKAQFESRAMPARQRFRNGGQPCSKEAW